MGMRAQMGDRRGDHVAMRERRALGERRVLDFGVEVRTGTS